MSLLPKCTCGYSGTCRPSYEGCTNKLHPSESAGVNSAEIRIYELEIVLYRLLKSFKDLANTDLQKKRVENAQYVLNKGFDPHNALRAESPTAAGDGKEDITDHEHEKEVMMQAFDKVRQLFEGRSWIMEGRGSYPYDDDRYKEEVRYMYDEFDALFKDTWANIKSKSFEYRSKIIEQYKKDSGKEEAVAQSVKGAVWVKAWLQFPVDDITRIWRWNHAGNDKWQRIELYSTEGLRKWMEANQMTTEDIEHLHLEWLDEGPAGTKAAFSALAKSQH